MFTDSLRMVLKLGIGGKIFVIPGGNIKTLKIDHKSYGFTCLLSFWISNEKEPDKLFPLFKKPDLIETKLTVSSRFIPEDKDVESLDLKGLVMQKKILKERLIENIRIKGEPVFYRHYQILFVDTAFALWSQHFPNHLMTERSTKDLLDVHKGKKVTLKYDWDALDEKFAINTLPLGIENNKDVSFYDFVSWYVDSLNGVWAYNSKKDAYTISKKKKDNGMSPIPIDNQEVKDIRIDFPETIRHNTRLLNGYSEDPKRQLLKQEQAVDGVVQEYLKRVPISSDFGKLGSLETERLKIREHELHITFSRFPQMTYRPGCLVMLESNTWSKKIFPYGKTYRIRDLIINAAPVEKEITADQNMPHATYNIEMTSRLELKKETWVSLPPFKTPVFPLYVEGKIVSEQGKDNEETFQIYQDQETSVDQYKVVIPLWDNQEVVIPFEPNFFSGHFYFPAYKNARVLVALDFHSARIERFLDWRPGARLPMDTQGNHLLLGKTAKSQTSISHVYETEKPVFKMKRTSDKDTERITMIEGSLILETREEDN